MHKKKIYHKVRKIPIGQILWNLFLLSLGSTICAVAINGIIIPHQFMSCGITGVSLIIHYLVSSLPIGLLYLVINIPIFAMGWKLVGKRFFFYSIAGMVIFSVALSLIQVSLPVQDQILSALLAGIITGTGSGIILRSLGSAGGTDILSVILLKRFSISIGTTTLVFNSLILMAGAILFSLEGALYSMVYFYVTTKVMDLVVTGLSKRKAVFIISEQWKEISREFLRKTRRGLTIIPGQGGYKGREEYILYTIIAFRDLPQLKQVIRSLDPDAFVVVMDTLEVMGQRMGNQPHW
ncbi:MAG: YitT family protein [Thermodesulfobacteriota bacterium]|nr:YitT family protein [Thermodesulfobacteriota bacterium]